MDSQRLVEALLGVAGIWLIAQPIPDFTIVLSMVLFDQLPGSETDSAFLIFQSARFAAYLLSGLILIFARKPLGRWLQPESVHASSSTQAAISVGLALIGVYFLVSGAVNLGPFLGEDARMEDRPDEMWRNVVSIILGLVLFIASPFISRVWRALFGGAQRAA